MSNVRSFDAFKKAQKKSQAAGKTLCKSGRHKWQIDKSTVFDSKSGKLVTRETCQRCGKTRVKGVGKN